MATQGGVTERLQAAGFSLHPNFGQQIREEFQQDGEEAEVSFRKAAETLISYVEQGYMNYAMAVEKRLLGVLGPFTVTDILKLSRWCHQQDVNNLQIPDSPLNKAKRHHYLQQRLAVHQEKIFKGQEEINKELLDINKQHLYAAELCFEMWTKVNPNPPGLMPSMSTENMTLALKFVENVLTSGHNLTSIPTALSL